HSLPAICEVQSSKEDAMRKILTASLGILLATLIALLILADNSINQKVSAHHSALSADPNPLLAEWGGPYGGIPPFDKVQVSLFKPALEAGMTENLADIDKIAKNPAPATFDNTIVAMERAGQTLDRVATLYNVWQSTMSSPDFQVVQKEMAPKLAAFNDQITQNE